MAGFGDLLGAAANGAQQLIGGYYQPPASGGPPPVPPPGAAGGLDLLDYRDQFGSDGPTTAPGELLTVTFGPVPSDQLWLLDRYTVSCTSTDDTAALLYLGDPSAQWLRDATECGNLDISDNNSPLVVPGSRSVTFVWAGATAGATAIASIQYRILSRP